VNDPDLHAPPELTLAAVYHEHAGFVWRALQRFGAGPEDAEDLLHEVFLVVRRRLGDFDPERSLRGWLYGIARGIAANHRRGRSRTANRMESLARLPPSPAPTPDEAVMRGEAAALVEVFLAGLDEPRRQVFELMDIEGLSGPEVAEALQIPLAQVHTRLRSARTLFQQTLSRRRAPAATRESA